jgi:hypothetical protein
LPCYAASRGKSVYVNVDPDGFETCLGGGNAPAPPAAPDIHQHLTIAAKKRPTRNWVAPEAAPRSPVEISIRIHQPVAYEGIDRAISSQILARRHVLRDRFSPYIISEDRNAIFNGEMMSVIALEAAIMRTQIRLICRAS